MSCRKVYTYRYTLMTAERMLEQAEKYAEKDNSMSAIVFCAFSLEGFLNHIGDELIPKWNNLFENLSPKAKLVLIADRYKYEFSFGKRPFQSFNTIFEIRNQLAHPKTKKHNVTKKVQLIVGERKWSADKWEILCKLKYAKMFIADTKEIIEQLNKILPLEKVPNFILSEHI